ncbi:hypothetical protein [Dryocola clanedunensis]
MKVKDNAQAGMLGGRRIVRFFLGSKVSVTLLSGVFFSLMILPPLIYSWCAYFPEDKDIKHVKGEFIYRYVGRGDYVPGIYVAGREVYFSCRARPNVHEDCINDRELYKKYKGDHFQRDYFESWKGKDAEVLWFNQPTNFFFRQSRLLQLTVNNVVVISRESVRKDIKDVREGWVSDLIIYFIFLALIIFFITKFAVGPLVKAVNEES